MRDALPEILPAPWHAAKTALDKWKGFPIPMHHDIEQLLGEPC